MKDILTIKLFRFILTLSLISAAFSTAFAQTAAKTSGTVYHPNPVLGLIDGQAVTFEDVRNKKVNDLSLQLYQQLSIRLMQYSLEILAAKHQEINLTPEKKVTLKEIIAVYEQNNLQERGTLEQLRPQIKQFLEQQIESQHYLNQYSLALQRGWVISNLEAPSDFLMKGNVKTAFLRGNKKASVILLEYSDYQCPFCGRVQETIRKLIENYKERVAFGYRHFPLAFHKEADEAAIASECAREQGKFEELHSLLYKRQKAQFTKNLKRYAREIQIKSPEKFDKCLDQEKYRGLVNQDMKDGAELGITGTPGFFVGLFNPKTGEIQGEVLSGAQPYSTFQQTLDKYLSRN
ncbi:MAG: thioredoxin domain-containing protein [SAR324 cluster bacterium]|nr:thioredoxin domain-containing protein [SAR324 cluster bacterium]MBL7035950.1 thioredoxin domain-containing protein [SAR324 cluster bacterium]